MINHVWAPLDKDLKRIFEKYLEENEENKMMKGFDETDQTLRSTVMFKWQKIKATYLRRYKGNQMYDA